MPSAAAQQTTWSPVPYQAPATASNASSSQPTLAAGPATQAEGTSRVEETLVQRWRKVEGTTRSAAPARSSANAVAERPLESPQIARQPATNPVIRASHTSNTSSSESNSLLNLAPAGPSQGAASAAISDRNEPASPSSRKPVMAAQWTERPNGPQDSPSAPAPRARLKTPPTQNARLVAQTQSIGQDPQALPPALPPSKPQEQQGFEEVERALQDPTPSLPPSNGNASRGGRSFLEQDAVDPIPPSAVPNPFPRVPPASGDSPSDRNKRPLDGIQDDGDLPPPPPPRSGRSLVNCDNIRTFASGLDIRTIRVDSSPNFVEGYKTQDSSVKNTKDNFVAKSPNRTWVSINGETIVTGRLVDLVLGTAIIEREDGTRTSYLLRRLSDPDQVFVAESWGIPVTCSLGDQEVPERLFTDSTFTWKASGLCHKPLYFEEVQLERYGHEWGPVVQPALSSITFFGNLAVLPYKMGIHPPNECQYALGYYRPGSCAPWTHGPVPISLRGALYQASFVTGTAWALP